MIMVLYDVNMFSILFYIGSILLFVFTMILSKTYF